MFINCSSKKFVSQSAIDISDAIQYNLSGGVEVLRFADTPQSLTSDVNDVVRYEIVEGKLDVVEFVEYKLNSEDWKPAYDSEIVLTGLMNGAQKISIRATSKTGSQSDELHYMWLVDSISPVITFNSKPAAQIIESMAQVNFSFSEAVGSVSCRLNNQVINNCSSPLTLNNLVTGITYQFLLQATDLVGNGSSGSFQFTVVDDGLPSISFLNKPNSYSNVVNPEFTFGEAGGSNSLVRFSCKIDDGPASACVSGVQTGNLEPGEHKLEVVGFTSEDVQSRVATYIWTIDTMSPSVAIQSGVFEKYIPIALENNSDVSLDADTFRIKSKPGVVSVPNSDDIGIAQVQCQLLRYKAALKDCTAEPTGAAQAACNANPYIFNSFEIFAGYSDCKAGYQLPADVSGGIFRLKVKATDLAGNQKITAAEIRIAESNVPVIAVHLSGGGALPGSFIVRDLNNQILESGYGLWGIDVLANPFSVNSMGIDWAVSSQILAGINTIVQESDKDKIKFFAIANRSKADSGLNKLNIGGAIEQFKVFGAYRQSISDSPSGAGVASFIKDPSSVQFATNIYDFQNSLTNEPASLFDVRSDSALADIWSVDTNTNPSHAVLVRSAVVNSVLNGVYASGHIRLGGYDIDGTNLLQSGMKDLVVGELLGRIVKTALVKNKKFLSH